MHWGTSKFIDLHDALQSAALLNDIELNSALLSGLEDLISGVKQDLSTFLDTPAKNQQSRDKIQKGTVTFDSNEFKLNQDFIDTSCLLADEINLDELACAELLFESAEESVRIGLNPVQGGVSLFHLRRQYILDIIRFLLIQADQQTNTVTKMAKLASSVISDISAQESLPLKVLNGLTLVEQQLVGIEDKFKRGEFLGQAVDEDFLHTLKLRREFSLQEHDILGQILYHTVENSLLSEAEFDKFCEICSQLSRYSTLETHYIPAFLLFPHIQRVSDISKPWLGQAFEKLAAQSTRWRMPFWANSLVIVMGSHLMGAFLESSGEFSSMTSGSNIKDESDILQVIETAIDGGGFEFLMAVASDTSVHVDKLLFQFQNYRTLLSSVVPDFNSLTQYSVAFRDLFTIELERVIHSTIAHLASTLKTMRNNEEDIYMSQRKSQDRDQLSDDENEEEQPGVDYERFILTIASVYAGRPNAGLAFWEDAEGDLHGFLVWAVTSSPSSIMISTTAAMLTALSCGGASASYAHDLLSVNGVLNQKTVQITWGAMLTKVYECYAFVFRPELKKDQIRALQDFGGIDGDTLLILCSYFQLMNGIAAYNDDALSYLTYQANVGTPGEVELLLTFMVRLLKVQSFLYGPIMQLMSTLFKPLNQETRQLIWNVVDEWLFDSDIYAADTSVIPKSSVIPLAERISSLFGSYADMEGLVNLLTSMLGFINTPEKSYVLPYNENLGHDYRTPGIWPYPHLVVDVIFSQFDVDVEAEDSETTLDLKLSCLRFVERSLVLFENNGASLASSIALEGDIQDLVGYLKSHPFAYTMTSLFEDRNYNNVFNLVKIGIDQISDRAYDDRLVQALVHSLAIIVNILDTQHIFVDIAVREIKGPFSTHGLKSFEDAILYNLSIVPYFLLYAGSANSTLAFLSLKLLQFVSLSSQFVSSSKSFRDSRVKNDRLLSAVITVDESFRIREAFMNQLERGFDAYESIPTSFYFENNKKSIYDEAEDATKVKMTLLNFLVANLERKTNSPTVAHFLLGFRISGDGYLAFDNDPSGIGSGISLLHSIVNILKNGIQNVSSNRATYESSLILSVCAKIVLLLVSKRNSTEIVLNLLRGLDFFSSVIPSEPFMTVSAKWDGISYTLENKDEFLESTPSATLAAFYQHRAAILEYASIEFYDSMKRGALSLVEKYHDILINAYSHRTGSFGTEPARLLAFLDFLEFVDASSPQLDDRTAQLIGPKAANFCVENPSDTDDQDAALVELDQLLWHRTDELISAGTIQSKSQGDWVKAKRTAVATYVRTRAKRKLDLVQCQCLESWSKLLLVLLNGDRIIPEKRSAFILEIFQSLAPKQLEYSAFSPRLTSALTSLLCSLLHIYLKDNTEIAASSDLSYDRTSLLFKTALRVLQMKLASPQIRRELYMISYLHLKSCLNTAKERKDILTQTLHMLRASGDRILNIASSDASSSDVSQQIPAIMFLEMATSAASGSKSSFVLDSFSRYNLLSLLIDSITSLGQTMIENTNTSQKELQDAYNVFTQIFCLLLQIVQSRAGATHVVQSGLFEAIRHCGMLNIDPDVAFTAQEATANHTSDSSEKPLSSYALLALIFQVVVSLLLSMGPENEPAIRRTRKFLDENQRLVITILRKDSAGSSNSNDPHFEQLVKSQVLLMILAKSE